MNSLANWISGQDLRLKAAGRRRFQVLAAGLGSRLPPHMTDLDCTVNASDLQEQERDRWLEPTSFNPNT